MAPPGTALIVCGGGPVRLDPPLLADPVTVIAVDGGADEALRAGLRVDVVVGDLDSITPGALARVEREGGRTVRFPADKDEIDLELALAEAVATGAERVVVAAADGGRFDFVLANALVLCQERFASVQIDATFGSALAHVVRTERTFNGRPRSLISLLAVAGPARGVRTRGLRWTLDGQDLPAASGWGISNEMAAATASVSIEAGVLLVVRPEGEG